MQTHRRGAEQSIGLVVVNCAVQITPENVEALQLRVYTGPVTPSSRW